jgi:hypothetical protein
MKMTRCPVYLLSAIGSVIGHIKLGPRFSIRGGLDLALTKNYSNKCMQGSRREV